MRHPSVFVRPLTPYEGQHLKRLSRTGRHFATRQRAQILLASASGMAAAIIAQALSTDEAHVRRVIKAFNEKGFESLVPNFRGGRPRKVDAETTDTVVAIALAPPQVAGVPITRWSLRRLLVALVLAGVLDAGIVSVEGLRQMLRRSQISWQRTRTWKVSTDPDYDRKAARVKRLYRQAERGTLRNAVVVCFDEFGPLSIKPQQGSAWARRRRPGRQRATYHRKHGVRHLFGAYDVGADLMWGALRQSKHAVTILEFLKTIRDRYPAHLRIYLVMDGLFAHWTADIRTWARQNKVSLVPTPTNASYLNRIECHFWALKEFAVNNSDYPDHHALETAIMNFIEYRNSYRHDPRILKLVYARKVA